VHKWRSGSLKAALWTSAKEVGIVISIGVVSATLAVSKADMLSFPVSKSRERGTTASQRRVGTCSMSMVSAVSH
jgi:ABC-type Fe3+-siderophore transport system permease subunit